MSASMGNPLEHLRDLQKRRGASKSSIPNDSIRGDVSRMQLSIKRQAQRFGNAGEIWEQLIPAKIRQDTRLSGISAGVLTVVTGSAATSYTLDGILRGGVDAQIRAASSGKIIRVRMRVGQIIPQE